MRTLALMLSAALLTASGAAQAANRDVDAFLERASAAATADLAASGVQTDQPLVVRARVSSDGRLANPRVVTSSGSAEADRRAALVVRRLRLAAPPNVLVGAEVNIAVGSEAVRQAQNPGAPTP